MKKLPPEAIRFFEQHHTVIVSSLDSGGRPHTSVKGLLEALPSGLVRLTDLYDGETSRNIRKNSRVALTAVDEHRFRGYCLKGHAAIIPQEKFSSVHLRSWEEWEKRLTKRIADRVLRNIKEERKAHPGHPEAELPKPLHIIEVKVDEIVDLTPR
ncbi:MAG: pyridoxamine 5'-phosphate oxidase family protein [Candidatus Omnitrophica bacterium]|nr:pyridoxamine 5'-phosphate oxidase family protein [Candidatus Omnitrophota bacterium]